MSQHRKPPGFSRGEHCHHLRPAQKIIDEARCVILRDNKMRARVTRRCELQLTTTRVLWMPQCGNAKTVPTKEALRCC